MTANDDEKIPLVYRSTMRQRIDDTLPPAANLTGSFRASNRKFSFVLCVCACRRRSVVDTVLPPHYHHRHLGSASQIATQMAFFFL